MPAQQANKHQAPAKKVLRVDEAARELNCTSQHILDLVEEGKIRAINIAGENTSARRFVRIPMEAWTAYLKENSI